MNDYHLDPPEEPEPPECCGRTAWPDDDGQCICIACGRHLNPPDIDGPDPIDLEQIDGNCCRECGKPTPYQYCNVCAETVKCPHNNKFGECDACDYPGDIAFDSAREARFFR